MPSRKDFQDISLSRLKEIKLLYRHGYFDAALYLSGYVLETALKARICRILNSDYPDSGEIARSFLTHKADQLLKLGGLQNELDKAASTNVDLKTNWGILTGWSEVSRYKPIGTADQEDVEEIINALENKNN
ncbi:MAG: HEPN domain-containing protein, partial [Chitinophagia bacterium]|nr:HEPN domain-containing protein [Chitinophagia bacterium]